MAVGLTISKIAKGQRSERVRSQWNRLLHYWQKRMQFRTQKYTKWRSWRRFALSKFYCDLLVEANTNTNTNTNSDL